MISRKVAAAALIVNEGDCMGGEAGERGEGYKFNKWGEGEDKMSGKDIIFDIRIPPAFQKHSIY